MAVDRTEVLIVGAGPTGLVLALWLNRLGVTPRIIDRASATGEASRALAVQARTLEFYRAFGLSESVLAAGLPFDALNLWVRGRKRARVPFGKAGEGLSPYPSALVLPQDVHERILVERLQTEGVRVDWETELVGFSDEGEEISASIRARDGTVSTLWARYLCGCDGARSTVREHLEIGFPGGTYTQVFYVADVEAEGEVVDGELHASLEAADFCLVFPMKGVSTVRLVGLVDDPSAEGAELVHEEVRGGAEQALGLSVVRVNWFSTYHVHHRVADAFRRGNVFLLGDAAHIHSPAGGQGMNTGIGDAVNLSWKLAMVLGGRARDDILDTYQTERMAFARRLIRTTDQAFRAAVGQSTLARFIRMQVLPFLLPKLWSLRAIQRLAFRTVSQIAINYRHSPLSGRGLGAIRGGDRLPWLEENPADNFASLRSLDWHIQVYGKVDPSLGKWCDRERLPCHSLEFGPGARRAGFRRNAAYLVRPDGHVACAAADQDPETFAGYLTHRGLRAGSR